MACDEISWSNMTILVLYNIAIGLYNWVASSNHSPLHSIMTLIAYLRKQLIFHL